MLNQGEAKMKTTQRFLTNAIVAAALGVAGMSGAQASSIACGDLTLGIRTTTVDPALSCLYAGLDNLGDPELISLLNDELGLTLPDTSVLIERDEENSNGGDLIITGIGVGNDNDPTSGTWSFNSDLWDEYARLFLYFHFGDAQDNPLGGDKTFDPTVDPDIFIVELLSPTYSGTWSFGPDGAKMTGLSNVALLGYGDGGGGGGAAPEPGILFLMGAGLLGLGMARRRKSA
jgi:hypothetical protein